MSNPWAASSALAGSPLLSLVTAIHFNAGAAAATIAAYCGCVIAATAPTCSAKYVTSAPTDLVFVVTATAPSVAQARNDSTISGQFSEWISTLSPLAMPRAARPAASLRTSASNAA